MTELYLGNEQYNKETGQVTIDIFMLEKTVAKFFCTVDENKDQTSEWKIYAPEGLTLQEIGWCLSVFDRNELANRFWDVMNSV